MTFAEFRKRQMKQNRGKVAPSEHDLQVACVIWFRLQYPRLAERRRLLAIPNGGWRNHVVASKLKAEGVVAGVPDLFLAMPSKGKHGLWIEMKNGKAGRLSQAQREMIAANEEEGYACAVCHSLEEFKAVVQAYL